MKFSSLDEVQAAPLVPLQLSIGATLTEICTDLVCGVKRGERTTPPGQRTGRSHSCVLSVYEIATVVSPQYETLFRHPVHPTAIAPSTRLHGKSFEDVHRYNGMLIRHYLISNLYRKLYKGRLDAICRFEW